MDAIWTEGVGSSERRMMTDINLPYDEVCKIIQDMADDYAPSVPKSRQVGMPMVSIFAQFGHTLWRALEEAHLASEAKENDD